MYFQVHFGEITSRTRTLRNPATKENNPRTTRKRETMPTTTATTATTSSANLPKRMQNRADKSSTSRRCTMRRQHPTLHEANHRGEPKEHRNLRRETRDVIDNKQQRLPSLVHFYVVLKRRSCRSQGC